MSLGDTIYELALKRSFFFPSNEPYGGTGGFYEYGPVGVLIKHKIENLWREMFIRSEGFHEVETSIITPEPVLVASGHVSSFADPVVECVKCKTRVRADTLAEEKHYSLHGEKWDGKLESLDKVISEKGLKCPRCASEFGKAHMFNLMFQTGIGGERSPAYCRPETAQGIFTAFPRIFRNHGTKLPMAVAQVGRSFRNEISPRKGLVRMREFTQMELEYFFSPASPGFEGFAKVRDAKMVMKVGGKLREMTAGEVVSESLAANEIMAYFLARQWEFYKRAGVDPKRMALRVLDKAEVPHYSKGNIDMEIETSFGTIETTGNAYRTDFDLSQHAKQSGADLSVFVESEKKKVVPHVFELSMGVDRTFYSILEHCYRPKDEPGRAEGEQTGKEWDWFDFPAVIAPYHVAVYPLMTKDGLDEKAQEVVRMLRESGLDVIYSYSGSIGRRYARADEIGIPYALTIDYDSLKDGTVTIRYRNDGKQERIKISGADSFIKERMREGKVTL
ncbi:MAG TPA: glycine--tRNA ligase [Candidatus Bilamarchaeum sp.]|nr:glycine--tRNA ligase [Candidatus Bilamarchaeum sp.]